MMSSPTSSVATSPRSPDMVDIHYLNELLNDRALLDTLPKRFKHVERILDQEIVAVRHRIFDCNFGVKMQLPEPVGEPTLHRKKIYIPNNTGHFNYVGRLLGPRGKTLKSIEQETGCKIMIRGSGSSRPNYNYPLSQPGSEAFSPQTSTQFNRMLYSSSQNRTQQFNQMNYSPSPQPPMFGNVFQQQQQYSDDKDPLHVLIQCEDTPNRADVRTSLAISLIENLFAPVDEAHDELKHKQLLELSILRGTFKPATPQQSPNVNLFDSGVFFSNCQQEVFSSPSTPSAHHF